MPRARAKARKGDDKVKNKLKQIEKRIEEIETNTVRGLSYHDYNIELRRLKENAAKLHPVDEADEWLEAKAKIKLFELENDLLRAEWIALNDLRDGYIKIIEESEAHIEGLKSKEYRDFYNNL